ncbi:MAG: tyrosine--tRNA ligase [Candidatus Aenigmarchaeota archaeon]|nr:tyrosine--tRNA ligase [Candidatus Aenigmarchaeota archaeon]
MDLETRVHLAKQFPAEEIITEQELHHLFQTNAHPKHYIGFEISGYLHLGSLFVTGYKIRDLLEAGCECTILLADWHSWINNKFNGDLEKIRMAAKYFEEGFKFFLGNNKKLKIILGSDLYHDNDGYWNKFVKISKAITLARVTRCLTIAGRKENETLEFGQYLYPSLQASDIWELDVDIAHAGMDQRKVHVLYREVADKLKLKKPVMIHTHLLSGLGEPELAGFDENPELDKKISSKMSKSKPWTAIYIHDSDSEIKDKVSKAWCPEKVVENNPVLDICRSIIFREKKIFEIERQKKFGGSILFHSYPQLEREYSIGKLHPQDLKIGVGVALAEIIKPVRKHFDKAQNKKLLQVFKETEITR